MLVIGNVYGHGFGKADNAAIEEAGFVLRPHEGPRDRARVCRFLDFEEGPALELIEVVDPRAYLDSVPDGMRPYAPGISLILPRGAERDLPDLARRHAMFRPYAQHVAYDGSGDVSRPGCNHLNFATPLLPGVFIWITRFDEPQPRRPVVPLHPNRATGVRGLVVDGDAACLRNVARVAEIEPADGAVTIEGVTLWPRASLDDVPRISGKAFPLLAVVVETPDLSDLPREVREGRTTSFASRPAVHIRTNDLAWDLIVTESDPGHPAMRLPTIAADAPRYLRSAPARSR